MADLFKPIPFVLGVITDNEPIVSESNGQPIGPLDNGSEVIINDDWIPSTTPVELKHEVIFAAKTLAFELKRRVCPGAMNPRSKSATFPMSEPVWHLLFGQISKAFKSRRRTPRPIQYHGGVVKHYTAQIDDLRNLDFLFGPEWYLSNAGINVAIHRAPIRLSWMQYVVSDYQTTLNFGAAPKLMLDSIRRLSLPYCQVKFQYTSTTRYHRSQVDCIGDLPDLKLWKELVEPAIVVVPKQRQPPRTKVGHSSAPTQPLASHPLPKSKSVRCDKKLVRK
jgi:hypothetical protein